MIYLCQCSIFGYFLPEVTNMVVQLVPAVLHSITGTNVDYFFKKKIDFILFYFFLFFSFSSLRPLPVAGKGFAALAQGSPNLSQWLVALSFQWRRKEKK